MSIENNNDGTAAGKASRMSSDAMVFHCKICINPTRPMDTARTFLKLTQLLRHVTQMHGTTKEKYAKKYPDYAEKGFGYR